jgi:hypothetical protein
MPIATPRQTNKNPAMLPVRKGRDLRYPKLAPDAIRAILTGPGEPTMETANKAISESLAISIGITLKNRTIYKIIILS